MGCLLELAVEELEVIENLDLLGDILLPDAVCEIANIPSRQNVKI